MDVARHDPCVAVRWQLCRLAVGATLGADAQALARHVRECRACDEFVDELAALRTWVSSLPPRRRLDRDDRSLRRGARVALARELAARLARDLADRVTARHPRPAEAVSADLRRLALLGDVSPVSSHERRRIVAALDPRGPRPESGATLALAARLDPLGLDLGLSWLGQLTRDGDRVRAQHEAERYLADVAGPGFGR